MTPQQRAGQLVMVGIQAGSAPSAVDQVIRDARIGNVLFLGGWSSTTSVRAVSDHVQAQANSRSTGGVRFLVAADQEGGEVQQLRGPGFTRLPSALRQGTMTSAERQRLAGTVGRELKAAGVNVNLAPVADTVPAGTASSNAPIGRFGREYGTDPTTVGASVRDVVTGLHGAGVLATVKHFPGLGRIRSNTDFSATGITDAQTRRRDPYFAPFATGVGAGAGLVMVSSARYPRLDANAPAVFSPTVLTTVLRGDLGFSGVVISDDLAAVAVRSVPVGERAVRLVAAGGDIALTGRPADAATMANALAAKAAADPAFDARVRAAVTRVLALKARQGLLPGCRG
ncbi:glycoside hydrolase family 3 protein [Calidifontibacter sp. DB0510]|uniref:beta-N-acetylhexosaminidase n=1 Tax=Metallococcus carri TaxID=1656884 RepID=A0A967B1M8_9MICO|nr:glycoside hydrolase family 3 protein [Metallococcus carri]NOP38947.1 glycoside hydrolase family 3 protein [Calidifontibacter sp. DB2511S]